jgi:anti-anti-sigma regulatory factor
MTHNDSTEQAIAQVAQALQATAANHSDATNGAGLQEIAARFVQLWNTFQSQPNIAEVQAFGTRLAESHLELRAVLQAGRTLVAGAAATDANADAQWQYLSELLAGYVAETKRDAQRATIVEFQATQQREDQLRAVIQELSTPIIPIYKGVLVLPLVGAIDSLRSQEITERLLEEIVRQQADMVIIDITGVSVVDTSVANHLIMTAQAVNLLGSKVIFTGISSTIAQTIIQLGVNLGDVVTLSNLQAGMLFALEQLGLGITELQTA